MKSQLQNSENYKETNSQLHEKRPNYMNKSLNYKI